MTDCIRGVFPSGIRAIQTTRTFAHWTDFDARTLATDPLASDAFRENFGPFDSIQWLKQVHGQRCTQARDSDHVPEADGCFTDSPSQVCAIITADCLPVLMANRQASWVAAVHCGWRSLYAGILFETVAQYPGQAEDLVIWLGPCIQRSAYQVSADFVHHYLAQHPDATPAFDPILNGHSHADLPMLAKLQLHNLGIQAIHQSNHCTHDLPEQYHSWRRNQSHKRMASMIWIE